MPPSPSGPTTWEAYARDLGDNLRRRRLEVGLTQEDLAHPAGMTRTHYQQIERGHWKPGQPSNPSLKVLVRLSQQLEVSPSELLPPVGRIGWQ